MTYTYDVASTPHIEAEHSTASLCGVPCDRWNGRVVTPRTRVCPSCVALASKVVSTPPVR